VEEEYVDELPEALGHHYENLKPFLELVSPNWERDAA
jgi:hypothetical protein